MEFLPKTFTLSSIFLITLSFSATTFAATEIDLKHNGISAIKGFSNSKMINFRELKRSIDKNQTVHVRMQQMFEGYDVLGADIVVHIPNGKEISALKTSASFNALPATSDVNGFIYQNLDADLKSAPAVIFTPAQVKEAILQATLHEKVDKKNISNVTSQLMVYITPDKKAHWVYKISFLIPPDQETLRPRQPVLIIDATTFNVYLNWDDIKNIKLNELGGGFGGNKKMGKLIYDGQPQNLDYLKFKRDDKNKTCYFKNDEVVVVDYNTRDLMEFSCLQKDSDHNNVYWDGDFDKVNGGYSPSNDALFGGQKISRMYQDWYGIPVLANDDGSPMLLRMVVHLRHYDNAYWDGRQMTFGDGYSIFYPLTSLGVAAHEISHGFTEQHSNLIYTGQSGGMNEAFSDMAAQAAEVYAYGQGKNSWQIGPEIFKAENEALRYMDQPSKDCNGGTPGDWCSIDDASQYRSSLDVHYSSGVYNRFFYTLGTTKGWDVRKAFDVMVQANANYWTSNTNFSEGACGVIKAAADLKYDIKAVKAAFDVVKVKYKDC